MVQNDKKFCLWHSVSQEPYIIWLSFMLHLCKMIMSPGSFFIFSKFWFLGLLGRGKRAKNGPKWQKIKSVALHIWGTIHHMTVIYVFKMIISSGVFFIYSKFSFSGSRGGMKGQKKVQNDKKEEVKGKKWQKITKTFVCLAPYLWNHTSYDCHFLYIGVKWWYLQQIF